MMDSMMHYALDDYAHAVYRDALGLYTFCWRYAHRTRRDQWMHAHAYLSCFIEKRQLLFCRYFTWLLSSSAAGTLVAPGP